MSLRTFRCLSCNDVINTSMTACKYCGAPIDPAEAQAVAEVHEKVNQAGFDASMIKQLAIWMAVAIPFSLLPLVGMIGVTGFYLLIIALPIFIIRWWVKYRNIPSNDPEYKKAKRTTFVALGVWAFVALFVRLTTGILF